MKNWPLEKQEVIELKMKINAEDGRQDLLLTRDFDLPKHTPKPLSSNNGWEIVYKLK